MKGAATIDATWPAAKIERRRVGAIRPYERNPNKHSKAQVEQIRRSMQKFGWTTPLLLDENDRLIAGHGRLAAAKLEGIVWAPVVVARGWSEDDKRAYTIADNELTRNSTFDMEVLAEELRAFNDEFDKTLTGLTALKVDKLVNPKFEPTDEDDQGLVGPHGATDGRSIRVTRDQYDTIRKAIDQARAVHEKPEMSEGAAAELIAEFYLAGAR